VRQIASVVLPLLLAIARIAAASAAEDSTSALRQLGVEIRLALDHADATGTSPSPAQLRDFERRLTMFRGSADGLSAASREKYQAVGRLLASMESESTQPTPRVPGTAPRRGQVDVEIVAPRHGALCANALGLTEARPVQFVLAGPRAAGGDAWLRFEPASAGNFTFTTTSHGADPALHVLRACGASAGEVASNDDSFGLDAHVTVSAYPGDVFYVHVVNSGAAGPVRIAAAATTGTIRGSVKDSKTGLPVPNTDLDIYDSSQNYVTSGFTDSSGAYSVAVPGGTYYVLAQAYEYVVQVYPGAYCYPGSYYPIGSDCDMSKAHTVTVSNGGVTSNINFALITGQRIVGQVRDALNQPLSATIQLYSNPNGNPTYASSDAYGHYTITTVPPGNYEVLALAYAYGSQMYDGVACGGALQTQCDLGQATPLHVGNQDATGINFTLPRMGSIKGTISPGGAGGFFGAQVTVLDAFGNAVASGFADSTGHYVAGPITTGTYYAYASASGFFSQLYSNVDCGASCMTSLGVATPIVISYSEQQATADFTLHPTPEAYGHVQDAQSGQPLAGVMIYLSTNPPSSFYYSTSTMTDANGNYTLSGMLAGAYFVWAQSNDHVDQVYSGIPCESLQPYYYYYQASCDVSGATLFNALPGQPTGEMDFALDAASSISGQALTRAGPGSDLGAGVTVSLYDNTGASVAYATADATGGYVIADLPPGNYYAAAQSFSANFIEQIWQQIDCLNSCVPVTTGTVIPVPASVDVPGIDFLMTRTDAVVGRVTDTGGNPIAGAVVDLFNMSDHSYFSSGIADADGFYAAGGGASSYYVATEAGGGYVDQIYSGIACPLGPAYYGKCSFSGAQPVSLGGSNLQPRIVNFVLTPNDRLFADGFE